MIEAFKMEQQSDPSIVFLVLMLISLVFAIVYFVKFLILKAKVGSTMVEVSPERTLILQSEYQALITKISALEAVSQNHKEELQQTAFMHEKSLQELKGAHAQQISALEKEKEEVNQKVSELQETIRQKSALVATLESEKQNLSQLRAEDEKRFKQSNEELEHRLNTLGEKLLKDRTESLEKMNKDNVEALLSPFKTELTNFRELINNTQKNNSEQAGEFKNELQRLQEAQLNLSKQAENLTSALLKGGKSQGTWGEQQLERILDLSGLREGIEYIRELSLQNDEGKNLRIDAWVKLPRGKGILVDAKCSLTDYTTIMNSELENDEKAYKSALDRHIKSIEKHIKELETKQYQKIEGYGSPDFVFMFVPIDNALAIALREKPELYDEAHLKSIYLVSPSTLIPALRMVSELWLQATQSDKMKKLVLLADRLYEKSSSVINHLKAVVDSTETLSTRVENLQRSLLTGQGSLYKITSNFASSAPALSLVALKDIEAVVDNDLKQDQTAINEYSLEDSHELNDNKPKAKRAAKNAPELIKNIEDVAES